MKPTEPMKHRKSNRGITECWSKRQIYRECGSKVRHKTQAEAVANAKKCMKRRGGHISVYHCRFCGGYHLTSKTSINNERVFEG